MQRDRRSDRKPAIDEMIDLACEKACSNADSWSGTTSRRACSRIMREVCLRRAPGKCRFYGEAVHGWPLDGSQVLDVVSGQFGSIMLHELVDPMAVVAIAHGAISLRMIRREVEVVARFADDHPQGWSYLADVRRVRLLNPVNLVVLQRIGRLPGMRRRVIVAPRLARWLEPIAIGDLTTSPTDALARCRA